MEPMPSSPSPEQRSATPLPCDNPIPHVPPAELSSAPSVVHTLCESRKRDELIPLAPPAKRVRKVQFASSPITHRGDEVAAHNNSQLPAEPPLSALDAQTTPTCVDAAVSVSPCMPCTEPMPHMSSTETSSVTPLRAHEPSIQSSSRSLATAPIGALQPPKILSSSEMFELFFADLIDFPCALHLFSGPKDREDGYAVMLRAQGVQCLEIDLLVDTRANLRCDVIYQKLCALARLGLIFVAIIGLPCKTWTVARVGSKIYPFQLRSRTAVHGLPNLSRTQRLELFDADELGRRSFALALIIEGLKRAVLAEAPVDRGDQTAPWFQPKFESHVALFAAEYVIEFKKRVETKLINFCQCECGSEFQKRTSILASARIKHLLVELERAQCSHRSHSRQAIGFDEVGDAISALASAYPAGMNAMLVGITVVWLEELATREGWAATLPSRPIVSDAQPLAGLHSGSSKPHAAAAEAAAHVCTPGTKISFASLRRLEPERPEVLRLELLPDVNVMPETEPLEPPSEPRTPPAPLTTNQLIPQRMQQKLHEHRIAVAACFDRAKRGTGWKWARDHRPEPLIASEHEALHPAGHGWKWEYKPEQKLWHAILPSRWPDAPPDTGIDVVNLLEWARVEQPRDRAIVSAMASGYPGPTLEPVAAIGSLHVGALKEIAHFQKCEEKDRTAGIGVWGRKLPPIWPCRTDYRNVVMRRKKPRVTIDKSMRLAPWLPSHNDEVDLDLSPKIEYVNVGQLGRARAILLTAGFEVVAFGFDLKSYFRVTGKNKSTWWMAGLISHDGYGVDTRVQFGDREAPVNCGRQTCLLAEAIKRELRRLDIAYPSKAASVIAYLAERLAKLGQGTLPELDFLVEALAFVLAFVDDISGMVINDGIYDGDRPVLIQVAGDDGATTWRQQKRGEFYLAAALGVIKIFGHSEAAEKTWWPGTPGYMPFLGISMDCEREQMLITKDKRGWYVVDILDMLQATEAELEKEGGVRVSADDLNSVVHKLLHASTCIVLGRQHIHHLMRCLQASKDARGGSAVLGSLAKQELRWWLAQLRKQDSEGVPMASRQSFPKPGPGTLAPYFDASRELKSPHTSGYGAWAIIGGEFCYVEGRWLGWELRTLSINVLELAARNIGTFTFLEYARTAGIEVTHLFEFTDNRAAELSAEFGRPHTPAMQELTKLGYVALRELGIYSSMLRIASVDNDIADGLSRGGAMLANALRIASSTGINIRRLAPTEKWRDLSALR